MDAQAWLTHLETDCDGDRLSCHVCGFNIYRNYKGKKDFQQNNADAHLGHNCIRDIKNENLHLKQRLEIFEENEKEDKMIPKEMDQDYLYTLLFKEII